MTDIRDSNVLDTDRAYLHRVEVSWAEYLAIQARIDAYRRKQFTETVDDEEELEERWERNPSGEWRLTSRDLAAFRRAGIAREQEWMS